MPTTGHHLFIPQFKDASSEWVLRFNGCCGFGVSIVVAVALYSVGSFVVRHKAWFRDGSCNAAATLELFRIQLARLMILAPDPAELESDADEDSTAVDEMEYNSVSSMCSEEDTTDTCSTCEFYVQFPRYVRR
jgi:hypothetical protein